MKNKCIVCNGNKRVGASILCDECGCSYDKAVAADETTANIIRWAAERARQTQERNYECPTCGCELRCLACSDENA